ncbi:MAG: HAD family phosphatase [Chloroflexi bacterium]|nr:HAD family phosphatase [Chloroflexota bacterium]
MKYKLIALDLDGTLIGRDLRLNETTKTAVAAAQSQGIMVTLATGRMFKATLPYARELNLSTPLICYQGALIKHPHTGEELFHRAIPLPLARKAIKVIQGLGRHLNVYVDDELYVAELTPEAEAYTSHSRVEAHPVGNLLDFLNVGPTKIVVVSQPEATDGVVATLQKELGQDLLVVKSYPMFCEIANLGCGKGQALAHLASHVGVEREETVAIGDNLNDIDMIEWAGLGIAMGHSPPALLAIADMVTGSLAEDGAARAIESLLKD